MRGSSVPLTLSVSVILPLDRAPVSGCVRRVSVTVGVTSFAEYGSTIQPIVIPHHASFQSATMPLMVITCAIAYYFSITGPSTTYYMYMYGNTQ